jgi:hypothetical protein
VARFQVVCVTKRGGHYNPHERITHLGILTAAGRERYSQEQIISWIESSTHTFVVSRGNTTVRVKVASRNGRKYLKTESDGDEPNNLLALPEC